jgi:uncharacterized protein (TIGR02145 family)
MRKIGLLLIVLSCQVTGYTQTADSINDIRDGNIYKIVKIGDHWWMAENLRFESKSGSWWYDVYPRYKTLFGRYYTFDVAKKVCPAGWHLPSDEEWQALCDLLGGTYFAGGKLKSKDIWIPPNAGATNETGFSAVPGGFRYPYGLFAMEGTVGYFWSSTVTDWGNCYMWFLGNDIPGFRQGDYEKECGLNVRCTKDQSKEK